MGFSAKQVAALRRNVDERHIRTRAINGRELSYLEGWYAISAANRIFGFDGWSRETVEAKCVLSRENRGAFLAVYTAKVRITVFAQGTQVIREGHGTGEGRGSSPGEAHDTALKAAETDATKRALTTFGKPFGLELYRSDSSIRAFERGKKIAEGQRLLFPRSDRFASPVDQGSSYVSAEQAPPTAPADDTDRLTDRPPFDFPSLPPDANPVGPVTGPADPGDPNSAPALQALQVETPHLPNAKPHPDDGTPIPRPSTHFGLQNYLETRELRGELIEAAREEALRAEEVTGRRTTPLRDKKAPRVRPAARIDKSALALPEPKRLRDKNHLRYVASQPCLVCGRQPADPHHLRFAQPRAIGLKVSDEFTVPLCRSHHRNLHQAANELRWWETCRIEPMPIARKLWETTHGRSGETRDLT